MKNIFNKTNAPYLVAGTLATLTLLASGVFAVAPYVSFLAPVAALSVGLPFIIGGAVFSAVAIALSAVVISKNKTIVEKESSISDAVLVLNKQGKENSELKNKVETQEKTISGQNDQLTKKEAEVKAKEEEITVKDDKLAKQVEEMKGKDSTIAKQKHALATQNKKIEEDALKVAIADGTVQLAKGTVNGAVSLIKGAANGTWHYGKYVYNNLPPAESVKGTISSVGSGLKDAMPSTESAKGALGSAGSSLKNAYDTSIESAKEKLSNASDAVGNGLKGVYNAMPSAESARNWVPSLKTAGWIAGGTGLLAGATYIVANGGFTVADNSSNAVGNPVNGTKGSVPILTSVCPRLTMQCQIDEHSNTLENALKSAENNFGIPEEGSLSNEGVLSSMYNKVSSVAGSLWGSFSNFISGSKALFDQPGSPEETIDSGVLDNLFSPRVDNGINTSRQQGTLFDSVDLKKLTQETHPSAYINGLPKVF